MKAPSITFFCELHSPELENLFSSNALVNQLSRMNANISLAIHELTPELVNIVKKLTRAGIPVTAWLLLTPEEGYWTSLDTIHQTIQKYADFRIWSASNELNWAAVGLDIEPRMDLMAKLSLDFTGQLPTLVKRLFSVRKYRLLKEDALGLIQQIHEDGYAVETYQFPSVVDERSARSSTLSRLLGLPALTVDREVLMLYSSIFGKASDAVLWSYAKNATAVAVGSTGGGVAIEGLPELRKLRWLELKRDLLMAHLQVNHLYIFSLEGCVEENILDRLATLDWDAPQSVPEKRSREISLLRKAAQAVLWSLSHPILSFMICFPIFYLLIPKKACCNKKQ